MNRKERSLHTKAYKSGINHWALKILHGLRQLLAAPLYLGFQTDSLSLGVSVLKGKLLEEIINFTRKIAPHKSKKYN